MAAGGVGESGNGVAGAEDVGDGGKWRRWLDVGSAEALRLLLMDENRCSPHRPALTTSLWCLVGSFLRFPGPMQMVYVFGGRRARAEDNSQEPLDAAEVFDWYWGTWTPIPSMSTKRVGAGAAVLGRHIVVAGGYDSTAANPLDSAEAFDPMAGTWRGLSQMPTRRYGLVLAALGDRVYAVGGDDGRVIVPANEAYSMELDAWTRMADMRKGLSGGKAESFGGKLFYVGGTVEDDMLSDDVWQYDPGADMWDRAVTPGGSNRLLLRIGRTAFAMTLLAEPSGASGPSPGRLLITGGVGAESGMLFRADTEMLPLGPLEGRNSGRTPAVWRDVASVPPMPYSRCSCRSVMLRAVPGRPYTPWCSTEGQPFQNTSAEALPYMVVLGGEAPFDHFGEMRQTVDPVVLDFVGGCWHETSEISREPPDSFLNVALRMRTDRVAFAVVVAQGLPRVSAHGG